MTTKRPRMALSLPDELHNAVYDLAHALGKPASKVVTELLQEMLPQLQGLTKIANAAKSGNKAAAKRALTHMVGDSMANLLQQEQPELFGKGKRK
jgi:DNA-binding GntR family transcriptional regulator